MSWSDSSLTDNNWNEIAGEASNWDTGDSLWDQETNVETSDWDVAAQTAWSEQTQDTTWSAASGSSPTWTAESGSTPTWT